MTATTDTPSGHECDDSARRNREALERLSQRRLIPGVPVQTMWPIDRTRHGLALVGRARLTRRFEPAPRHDPPPTSPTALPKPALSRREIEVLRAWLVLDSKLDVAETLHIAMGTVNTHLTRIRAKYSEVGRPAPTKASLVARAVQDGHVSLDEL